jgi:hypothetical protein
MQTRADDLHRNLVAWIGTAWTAERQRMRLLHRSTRRRGDSPVGVDARFCRYHRGRLSDGRHVGHALTVSPSRPASAIKAAANRSTARAISPSHHTAARIQFP